MGLASANTEWSRPGSKSRGWTHTYQTSRAWEPFWEPSYQWQVQKVIAHFRCTHPTLYFVKAGTWTSASRVLGEQLFPPKKKTTRCFYPDSWVCSVLQQTFDSTQTEVGGSDVQSCTIVEVAACGVQHCEEHRKKRLTSTWWLFSELLICF